MRVVFSAARCETLRPDAIQRLACSQEQGAVDDGSAGQQRSVQLIDSQFAKRGIGFNDGGRAIVIKKVNPSVGVQRRRPEAFPDPLTPMLRASFRIDAGCDSIVRCEIDGVSHQEWRRDVGDAAFETPRYFGRAGRVVWTETKREHF